MSDLIPKTATFDELIAMMDDLDNGVINVPDSEMEIIGEKVAEKVDNLKRYLDFIETRRGQMNLYINKAKAIEKALANKAKSVNDYIAYSMVSNGFEKLPGDAYSVGVYETESVDCDEIDFDEKFMSDYGHFVRVKTSYEFDKTKLKPVLKDEKFPFARLKKSFHLRWSIKGGK